MAATQFFGWNAGRCLPIESSSWSCNRRWPADVPLSGLPETVSDHGMSLRWAVIQERGHRVGEARRILPEEQVAAVGEGHQFGAVDPAGQQSRVARVDDGVRVAV